ncbi:sigma-54-dependent Fis family transcriptional regulator [Tenuifilum thalassicum]|uniref:PAS domain S-box protein n=1 Tax=Tenuifilum thalassicum TaxID=2590900 RepID=A0A7D4BDA1_9BACT|nr:sigma 54-interacting transcriptional regulator [Tenuifilum thalassicum]QKG79543.1 PAS domain S-box protein [Tenuifilum thalassicum]
MKGIIAKSHYRSAKYGIEQDLLFPKKILSNNELEAILAANRQFIDVAKPIIQNLYSIVKGSGFVIILTDGEGCILDLMGDSETVKDAAALNMIVGAYMAEESVGTNAMGLAISENKPVQVTAQEHFINAYHRWTCSSAPIHDQEGKIIGVLNLTGKYNLVHPHTLGLVVAAVKSIENDLRNTILNRELQETSTKLDAIINSLSYAIITVDIDGVIERVNNTVYSIFGVEPKELIGSHISKYLDKWNNTWRIISSQKQVVDEEVTISNVTSPGSFVMNAMPIILDDFDVHGAVLTFREMKRVYKIVNKYSGMNAHYTFDDIIGTSKAIREVIDFAKIVAASPSTILITGESGTGKEVFAQAIHNESSRRDSSFVAVNCGAIPESLIESELFGFEDGAFTGAKKGGRPGKFELANGGTLFLDEIGEMPLDMQVKLLRALQEGEITRVGSTKTIPLDVRVIAATNRDLKQLINENKFRLDLYYRLNVIPLKIPPLRERREDIPLLINYFLNTKALKLNKEVPSIDKQTYELLLQYEWPGNIRELENFIEKTVNLNGKIVFDVPDENEFKAKYYQPNIQQDSNYNCVLRSLAEIEKQAISDTIEQCNSNVSKAAKVLGISRNTLYLKCKKYSISL